MLKLKRVTALLALGAMWLTQPAPSSGERSATSTRWC